MRTARPLLPGTAVAVCAGLAAGARQSSEFQTRSLTV